MQCKSCGTQIADNLSYCPNCGAQVAQDNQQMNNQQETKYQQGVQYQQPMQYQSGIQNRKQMQYQTDPQFQQAQYGATVKEQKKNFFKSPECSSARKLVTIAAVLMYISAAVTLCVALTGNYSTIIDVILLVVLGVLLQTLKSRVVACISGAYGVVNVIVISITSHSFGGWFILIAAVCAIIGTFTLQSKWNKLINAGTMQQAG